MNEIPIFIDTDVAIPSNQSIVDRLPWHKLRVGSSFAVTKASFGEHAVERLRTAISYRQKATNEKYSVRKMPDQTYRCWRVK